jgi:hypothetical protein
LGILLTDHQNALPNRNGTLAPLIIASDKTSLSTLIGGQQAYPVYVSIGNISKKVRRKSTEGATVLLGYLPVDKFEDVKSPDERARLRAELTHRAMEALMEPLKLASEEGVDMWCSDGYLRRVYPILAAFVADWPEQCELACAGQGGCPICTATHVGRGDYNQQAPLRDPEETLAALRLYYRHNRHLGELNELNLKPWWPWWANLPHTNFHACITPDLLHQLHNGRFKSHILKWAMSIATPIVVDRRFMSMTRAEGMRHFNRRVSKIKNWTGRESKELMKQILPLVTGELPPDAVELVRAALDFMYQAHASRMSDEDLEELEHSLATFHRLKGVIVSYDALPAMWRFDNIPKIHMCSHYKHSTCELGTPDGYNTESPEHLHVPLTKKGYRASNKVNPYPQMVKYIQRFEAIRIHRAYMDAYFGVPSREAGLGGNDDGWYDVDDQEVDGEGSRDGEDGRDGGDNGGDEEDEEDEDDEEDDEDEGEMEMHTREDVPDLDQDAVHYPSPDVAIAKQPTRSDVRGTELISTYGATDLVSAIGNCLRSRHDVENPEELLSPHHSFNIWHRLTLYHRRLPFAPGEPPKRDVIRARPPQQQRPGEFDTVLFLESTEKFGLERTYFSRTFVYLV